jgi:hypothetical protein
MLTAVNIFVEERRLAAVHCGVRFGVPAPHLEVPGLNLCNYIGCHNVFCGLISFSLQSLEKYIERSV